MQIAAGDTRHSMPVSAATAVVDPFALPLAPRQTRVKQEEEEEEEEDEDEEMNTR